MKRLGLLTSLVLLASSASAEVVGIVGVNAGYMRTSSTSVDNGIPYNDVTSVTNASSSTSAGAYTTGLTFGLGMKANNWVSVAAYTGFNYFGNSFSGSAQADAVTIDGTSYSNYRGQFSLQNGYYVPVMLGFKVNTPIGLAFGFDTGAVYMSQQLQVSYASSNEGSGSGDRRLSGWQPALNASIGYNLSESLNISANYFRSFGQSNLVDAVVNGSPMGMQSFTLGLTYYFDASSAFKSPNQAFNDSLF